MPDASEKPAILQDQVFTTQEGVVYRTLRTGAIWMNKLFLSTLTLLVVWLILGWAGQVPLGCVEALTLVEDEDGAVHEVMAQRCSVWLSPTALFLGAMALLSFALSIAFGLVGLVVGKRIVAMTPTQEEVGARPRPGLATHETPTPDDGSTDGARAAQDAEATAPKESDGAQEKEEG